MNEQLTHSTVNKYLTWAEGAYLCSLIHQYSFKARERVNSDKKIYLFDTGFYGTHKHSAAKDFGRLLECYVFAELCRHGQRPNISLFSYQTKSRLEVDFFIPASRQDATLIQVCYSMTNIETRQREIRALLAAAQELNVRRLFVLTCDDAEQRFVENGYEIQVLPIWQRNISDLALNA